MVLRNVQSKKMKFYKGDIVYGKTDKVTKNPADIQWGSHLIGITNDAPVDLPSTDTKVDIGVILFYRPFKNRIRQLIDFVF